MQYLMCACAGGADASCRKAEKVEMFPGEGCVCDACLGRAKFGFVRMY